MYSKSTEVNSPYLSLSMFLSHSSEDNCEIKGSRSLDSLFLLPTTIPHHPAICVKCSRKVETEG